MAQGRPPEPHCHHSGDVQPFEESCLAKLDDPTQKRLDDGAGDPPSLMGILKRRDSIDPMVCRRVSHRLHVCTTTNVCGIVDAAEDELVVL